jgi:hypothetical protein
MHPVVDNTARNIAATAKGGIRLMRILKKTSRRFEYNAPERLQ